MDELAALFGDFEGVKDDLMNFGIMGASAVGGHVLAGVILPYLPAAIPSWGKNAIVGVLGVIAGHYAAKYVDARVGNGLAVGMVAAGLTGIVREFAPQIPLAGPGDELLLGLNEAPLSIEGAPTAIEQVGAAPLSIEGMGDVEEASVGHFASSLM
jgi:hypothetical protein